MNQATTLSHDSEKQSRVFLRGPSGRPSIDAALAETIITLSELQRAAFECSRNSASGLFFAQHRLLLMRLVRGKVPSQADWLSLAALGRKTATRSEEKAA